MNQSEITINKIAQDKIAFDEGLAWFDALAPNLHKKVIQNLVYFIHQAHPDKDAINEGLENAPIKKTMTPIVLMRTNENLKVAMDKIALLPDSETRKSFITLMSVFKVADAKRRETWCKNGCTHEWHNLNT